MYVWKMKKKVGGWDSNARAHSMVGLKHGASNQWGELEDVGIDREETYLFLLSWMILSRFTNGIDREETC